MTVKRDHRQNVLLACRTCYTIFSTATPSLRLKTASPQQLPQNSSLQDFAHGSEARRAQIQIPTTIQFYLKITKAKRVLPPPLSPLTSKYIVIHAKPPHTTVIDEVEVAPTSAPQLHSSHPPSHSNTAQSTSRLH